MATEGQLNALENWLGVKLEDVEFEIASEYLDRLHEASEAFKNDKTKKGIVKRTKQEICDELRKAGKIRRPEGEQKLDTAAQEEETVKGMIGAGDETLPERQAREARQDQAIQEAHAQAEIAHMATVMRFCIREAVAFVNAEFDITGLSEAVKANLIDKKSTTLFIEASRRGL